MYNSEGASDIRGLLNQRTRWRHGFLQCLLHNKSFGLTTSKKGKYLTFVDFPIAILGLLEILLFPAFIFFIVYSIATTGGPLVVALSYTLLPFSFFLLLNGAKSINLKVLRSIVFLPIIFTAINIIELTALLKAIGRMISKKQTSWTRWQRSGV